MESLPFLAPFPAQALRDKFNTEDWQGCVQAWILFLNRRLVLSDKQFPASAASDSSLTSFLTSYCREAGQASSSPPGGDQLHGLVFRLAARTLQLPTPPVQLLTFAFLSDFSGAFGSGNAVREILHGAWAKQRLEESVTFSEQAKILIKAGSSKTIPSDLEPVLRRSGKLARSCPDYGRHLLAGSEVLDALVSVWSKAEPPLRRKVIEFTFLVMRSLVLEPQPNPTALLDQLYDLKSAAEASKTAGGSQAGFLAEIVSTTAVIGVLRQRLRDTARTRAQPLIAYLQTLDDGTLARRRRVRKGKKRADVAETSFGHGVAGEVHMHKMASISQIQELFPDLGAGFVVKLLDHYQDNVEQVTAALLEDSLPASLAAVDRTEPLVGDGPLNSNHVDLAPRSTPPLKPQRRNIYDDEEFDQLAISTRNLHIGKREEKMKLQPAGDKAKIYAALASFDSDDDERDDTYDGEDVGGTVDVQGYDKDADDAAMDQNSEALFRAWKLDSRTFERDPGTRKSAARQALKSETNLTDEAIEGFAIMLHRDRRRLRALEAKYPDHTGDQKALQSTKWRQEDEGAESTEGEGSGSRGRGGIRGRGRGGRGRGRGRGNVAGPADDRETQIARQRKDENKAQRANHNRRAQRAKKLARAGFPG